MVAITAILILIENITLAVKGTDCIIGICKFNVPIPYDYSSHYGLHGLN